MRTDKSRSAVAFAGDACIAAGTLDTVALAAQKAQARPRAKPVLIFDAATSEPIDLDLRGSHADVLARLSTDGGETQSEAPRGPGRPKLGVVAREITLLPRHWDWLNRQPGGASVALRKLVEHAARANAGKDRVRAAQNAAYRFMSAMAGDRAGFEEAARALFAGDDEKFEALIAAWPKDVRDHVKKLATPALRSM